MLTYFQNRLLICCMTNATSENFIAVEAAISEVLLTKDVLILHEKSVVIIDCNTQA